MSSQSIWESSLLKVERISSFYGPIQALREVSLEVGAGEAVAVLGPNGAGKSTLLHTISGLMKSRQGSIKYKGREIAGHSPHSIVRLGIVHVPEGRRIFSQMTVLENLMMGAFTRDDGRSINEDLNFVYSLFPDLGQKKGQLGGELSGGQQQMLAIGRALMGRPSLLLLDEPSLGLSPILVEQMGKAIADVRQRLGMSILLVEQNVWLAMEMASHIYVMQSGRVALSGSTEEISIQEIGQAYLGRVSAR
jgi:branched-chain amino acid transport system ATP-binding protein